jgi:hypothetical protein
MADIINNAGEGTVGLPQVSAPTSTTDKLYNVSGALTWNGTDLTAGGGTPTGIEDADGDTSIETDTSDDDFIRFDTGQAPVGFPGNTNTVTIASSGFTVALPATNVNGTVGAPVSLTAGAGAGSSGAGGKVELIAGVGTASSRGGAIELTSGVGGSTAGIGGDIDLTTGAGGGGNADGGGINLTTGTAAAGGGGVGGPIVIDTGDGGATAGGGDGGDITFTTGDAGGSTSRGGNFDVTLGEGSPSDTGGNINLTGGPGGSGGGLPGAVNILGGSAQSGNNFGGDVNIDGGTATNARRGGDIAITGGTGGTTSALNSFGGNVSLISGAAGTGSNSDGGDTTVGVGDGDGTGDFGNLLTTFGGTEFCRTRAIAVTTTNANTTSAIIESMAADTTTSFEVFVVGREDATGDSVYARISGIVKRIGFTTSLVGTNTTDRSEDAGATTWTITVIGNDGADVVIVQVKGETAHTIDWKIRAEFMTV